MYNIYGDDIQINLPVDSSVPGVVMFEWPNWWLWLMLLYFGWPNYVQLKCGQFGHFKVANWRLFEQFQFWLDKSTKSLFQIIWKYRIHRQTDKQTNFRSKWRAFCLKPGKALPNYYIEYNCFTPREIPTLANPVKVLSE